MILQTMLLAVLFSSTAVEDSQFLKIHTDTCNIKLNKIELNENILRRINFGVDAMLKTYEDTFDLKFPEWYKVNLVLFKEQQDFLDYQKQQIGEIISEGGYFSYNKQEAVACLYKGDLKITVGVLFHEANHMMLMSHMPWVPDWINEGLSVFFEGMNMRNVTLNQNRSDWCKRWVKEGFPIEFKQFISLDDQGFRAFNESHDYHGYTLGYSIVYFLMTNAKTQDILKGMLWDFKKNGRNADSVAIIDEHFPGGTKKLEMLWKRWIPRARSSRPLRALAEKSKTRLKSKNNTASSAQ